MLFDDEATLDTLVDQVLDQAYGGAALKDRVTFLTADIAATDLVLSVDSAQDLSRGVLEIGTELIRINLVDQTASTATALPHGRGYRGTTAQAHLANDTVTMGPVFARASVIREVNNQIVSLYPALWGTSQMETTFSDPTHMSFDIPDEAELVLDVRWRDIYGNWQRVRDWEVDSGSSLADSSTGRRLWFSGVPIGFRVQVNYGTRLKQLATTDSLISESGLGASARDLVVLGALIKILPALDMARLSINDVAADEMSQQKPIGSASILVRELKAQYTDRLAIEQAALQRRWPARCHFTR